MQNPLLDSETEQTGECETRKIQVQSRDKSTETPIHSADARSKHEVIELEWQ